MPRTCSVPNFPDTPDDGLALAADAWLPTSDPAARRRILTLLEQASATGADPIAQLRDGLSRWFGPRAATALPPGPSQIQKRAGTLLPLEPLYTLRQPTLWPQRPKRLPDELFSSWLWRTAVAAGVPPRVFVRQVIGGDGNDIDRDIGEAMLQRLAQVTGQTTGRLAGGLLRMVPDASYDAQSSLAENVVLSDEHFLLTRGGHDPWGRPNAALQYCSACLAADGRPYFRRSWRLAHVVVCLDHGCRLHDRCWQCDRPVMPLAQRTTDPVPCCPFCHAVLAEAPAVPGQGRRRQAALRELLLYLALRIPVDKRSRHLDALRRWFGATVRARVAEREIVVASLLPASITAWFGRPADGRHAENLQMLAEGLSHASLAVTARQNGRWTLRTLNAKRTIQGGARAEDAGRSRALPDYSAMARTLTWTLIEGQRERAEQSARHGVQSADQNR